MRLRNGAQTQRNAHLKTIEQARKFCKKYSFGSQKSGSGKYFKMERSSSPSPSFLKKLMEDDFTREIRIPYAFVSGLEESHRRLPSKCTLITEDKNLHQQSWPVRIRKKGRYYYICKQWKKFARDHKLENGDSLLFRLVDKTRFEVIPYGADCCRKMLHEESSSDDDDTEEEEEDSETEESESDEDNGKSLLGKRRPRKNYTKGRVAASSRSNRSSPRSKKSRNPGDL